MTEGQTAIPVDESVPEYGPCAWCGIRTNQWMTVAKPRYRNDRGARVVAKRARHARACDQHLATVVREDLDGHAE